MKKILLATLLTVIFPLASIAQEPCKRHAEPKGGFSFCPPEGWAINEDPKFAYKTIVMKQSPEDMAKQTGASEIGPASQSDFITTSKEIGIKVTFQSVSNGLRLRSTMYFFAGKGDNKLLVTFTALETQAQVLDSVFDRSMKSWQMDRLPE